MLHCMMLHRTFLILIGSFRRHYACTHLHLCEQYKYLFLLINIIYSTIRVCNETCTINGVTFLEGCNVIIPIQYLHYSPEHWDQPYVFKPSRYLKTLRIKSNAWLITTGLVQKARRIGILCLIFHLVGDQGVVLE